MRDSLKIRFCSYSILFIARYADALPSLPFPLQPLYETGVCDFTWYTSPQTGNPLYGLGNVDGVLSHAASGHCLSKGRPTCKGFTVFPPSWQTGRCPDGKRGSSSREDILNQLTIFHFIRGRLSGSVLHSRCCLRPGGLQSDFIYEEGRLPRH